MPLDAGAVAWAGNAEPGVPECIFNCEMDTTDSCCGAAIDDRYVPGKAEARG